MNQPPSDPFGSPGQTQPAQSAPYGGPPDGGGGGPFGGPPPGGGFGGPPPGGGFGGPPPGGGFGGPPGGGGFGPPGGGGFGPPGGGGFGPPGGYGGPPGGGFGPPGPFGPQGMQQPFVSPPRASSGGGAGIIVGIIIGVVVLFGGLIAGAAFWIRSKAAATVAAAADPYSGGEVWSDDDASVPVSSRDATWGNRGAPVTLVVFSDFQCPFCSKFETTLSTVKEKYGADKLRIVWKHNPLPFHNDAKPAAIAAEAVFRLGGSKAFWKFHASAFANQRDLNQTSFEQWAQAAGVDVAKFRQLQADPLVAAKIEADMAEAKAVGVTGTPNSFVNGFFISGAQPLEKVTSLVDSELASAQRAIAAGTPADRVYSKLSQENKAKNPAPTKPAEPEDDNKVYTVPVGDSPSRGPATAKVTIVEFADFQCPFCARAENTLSQLREIYGDKVRIVWKDNPLEFHKNAAPAAELAREARSQKGDKGFWAAHDLLYKNQTAIGQEDLESYAAELHLDVAKVKSAMLKDKYKSEIGVDQKLAGEVNAKGTPTFFINGHRLTGAQPIEKFKALIDRELAN